MRGANHAISAALHVAFIALICAFTNETPSQIGSKKQMSEIDIEFITNKQSTPTPTPTPTPTDKKRKKTHSAESKRLLTQNANSERMVTQSKDIKRDIQNDEKISVVGKSANEKTKARSSPTSESTMESEKDTPDNSQIAKRSNIKPACKRCIKPNYPRTALRRSQEGYVLIELTVNTSGRVMEARIIKSSGIDSIDNAAIKAAKKSTFIKNDGISIFTIAYDLKIAK